MVRDACDANDGHTGRSYLLIQRSPQMGKGALLPFEPQGTRSEGELLPLQTAPAGNHHELLELAEAYAPEKGLVERP